jgi:hypothetical protein
MSDYSLMDSAPQDRVFIGWDGEAQFLCGWHPEDGWCVMNSNALEDVADDGEDRTRTADPILWTDLPPPPT